MLRRLNRLLMEQGEQTRFCTLAAAEVRVTTDGLEVCLVCAGHPPPVLVPARGSARFVGRLGTLIGVTTELDLPETYVRLGRGDLLVFYTDGVLERRSDSGALFGEDRLLRLLATRAGSPAEAVADAIEAEVRRFARAPLRDDLAVLVVGAR